MRYVVTINQQRSCELGINYKEAVLLALFNELSSWADNIVIDGEVFYFLSRNKVIEELPLFFKRPDTVYRYYNNLHSLGLIEFKKKGLRDCIRLTAEGKRYNKVGKKSEFVSKSEKNPSEVGKKSEFVKSANLFDCQLFRFKSREKNPTHTNAITNNPFLEKELNLIFKDYPIVFDSFLNNEQFLINVDRHVKSIKPALVFQKDVVPVILKWLVNAYGAQSLDTSIPKLKIYCLAYLKAVFISEVNKIPEPDPMAKYKIK